MGVALGGRVMMRDALIAHGAAAHDDVADGGPGLQRSGEADAEETTHTPGDQMFHYKGGDRRADSEAARDRCMTGVARDDVHWSEQTHVGRTARADEMLRRLRLVEQQR